MVLEAWEGAEKVGFPVIGEERKDASNVIDYNINKEITIDTNSLWNANNETTTGQATLVYGVNAPKIIDSTSIYNKNYNQLGSITANASKSIIIPTNGSVSGVFQNLSLGSLDGRYNFQISHMNIGGTIYENSAIYIPEDGIYRIQGTVNSPGSYYCTTTFKIYKNQYPGEVLDTLTFSNENYGSIDITVNLKRLDFVRFDYKQQSSGGHSFSLNQTLSATITKIG